MDLQLGIGENFERTQTPVLVSALEQQKIVRVRASFTSAAIEESGQLFLWGRGIWGEFPLPH